MDLYVIRRPSTWADLDELKATDANSARFGSEEMAERVRWFRTYAVHEPDGWIGTLASMTALIPSRSASMPARGHAGRGVLLRRDHVVVGTDPIEAKAAE